MSLIARGNSQKQFELVPPGTYPARCWSVVDLGSQPSVWDGETKMTRKLRIGWEILDGETVMEDGRNFSIFSTYTLSLGEKSALRRDLTAWRGKPFTAEELEGFDLQDLIGVACLIGVVHNVGKGKHEGKTFANLGSITKPPKGMDVPECTQGPEFFSLDEMDLDAYDKLSDYLKNKIASSPEWKANTQPQADGSVLPAQEDEDSIPF